MTMPILRSTLTIFTLCGCLRPSSWSSPLKGFLYNVYTAFVFVMVHTIVISQILDIVFFVDNQNDFSDNIYLTVATIIACYKMCRFLISQETYRNLIDTLNKEPFLPMSDEENEIRARFDKQSEWNTITFTTLVEFTVFLGWAMPLIGNSHARKLTYRAWIPYDYSSFSLYIVTYVHQTIGVTLCSLVNVACDTLFNSLLIHTYCQLEILGHRLKNITKDEMNLVKQCARHHKHIYKFATKMNKEFQIMVGSQFLTSLLVVCFSLYRLTQKEMGSKFMDTVFYAFCILMEIFYYCWYGNQVKLKSLEVSDVIFQSNWTALNDSTKKILLMIMRRTTAPINYTSIHVVTMDLESFVTLLKTSYSAYNVLQQSKK